MEKIEASNFTAELVCTVVSILPWSISEEKPGLVPPRFIIPASPDALTPICVYVGTSTHYIYLDDARGSMPVRNPPEWVCRAIVNDYVNAQLGVSEVARPGLFWLSGHVIPGAAKHDAQYQAAIEKQNRWFVELCKIADDDWNKYHQHNVISETQRMVAQLIGYRPEQHEWMAPRTTLQSTRCPSCSNLLPENTVVCGNCKCVIDKVRFKELTFAS
ncbi:MAG: hypothetical protein ACHQ1H_06185 [Nitrososphaerales archaeon]